MTTELASYALEESVAVVRMDDGKANALSGPMIDALLGAVARAEAEASALILTGRPGRFCAGFDLKVMTSGPAAATALLGRGMELLMRLYGTRLPLVVACTGHALAGGALLLLTGDTRLGASGEFRIGLNEVSIGMPVPILAMELARDRLAPAELVRATLQAQIYGVDDAARAGYLDRVVAPDALLAQARQEAARLAALPAHAFQGTKQRLRGKTIAHVLATFQDDARTLLAPATKAGA